MIVPCLENDPHDPQDKSADLPIIQGGESLTYHKAVIEMDGPNGMQVTYPGPGGYKIEWSPGSVIVPLEKAASGHPMMPIGAFSQLPKDKEQQGGLPPKSITFHATRREAEREHQPASEIDATNAVKLTHMPPINQSTEPRIVTNFLLMNHV